MDTRFDALLCAAILALCASAPAWATSDGRSVSTGVVVPVRTVDIAAKHVGRITRVHVDTGQHAAARTVLIEIDAAELLADRAAAEANMGSARVERDHRERVLARLEKLGKTQSVSEEALDEARYALAAAEQRLHSADAQIKKVDALLAETRIEAPFAGVLTLRNAEVGQLTQPGATLLRLEDHSGLELHTRVKEQDVPRIRAGDAVAVTVDALAGEPLEGRVKTVVPSGDTDHTFMVEVELPAREGLYPGMFGKAVFGH